MKISELLIQLKQRNIFICPDISNIAMNSGLQQKDTQVEEYCIKEVSKLSLFYHIQLSIWNLKAKQNSLIVRIRQNPEKDKEFFEDSDEDWKTIQLKSNKCKILDLIERSPNFSKRRYPNTVSHSNMYFLIEQYQDIFPQNSFSEQYEKNDIILIDTLTQFLK